ncbi:MAG: glycosyltransferase [Candidatus Omnitrophica bacterium]|nr:glycosyltransferase [Candidatus Omnitrophota bacterium]
MDFSDFSRHPIVVFSTADWRASNPVAQIQLIGNLSKYTRILFINTISPSMPKLGSSSFYRRLKRKLPGMLRIFSKPKPNLYVFSPIILPFIGNRKYQKWYTWFIYWQVRALLVLLKFKNPIIWASNLSAVDIIPKFQKRLLVYFCNDKFDKSRYVKNKELLQEYDREMANMADVIFCVSREIYAHYQKWAPERAYYLPHAIHFAHFSAAYESDLPLPDDLAQIKKPIIGYHGSLTGANDLDLLYDCAQKRPDWSFVLIGRITGGDYQPLEELPNVHFLGPKSYDEIPCYLKGFDAGLLFWKLTEWIRYCNPFKTKEYLAMGLPVVSVDIPEVRYEYSDVIFVAEKREDFLAGIEHELATDSPEKKERRRAKVMNSTYDNQVQEVISILLEKINSVS